MDAKKILATGIPAGFVIFAMGNLTYYAFQGVFMSVPADFWKPMVMPGWIFQLLLVNIFTGVLIAAAYDALHDFVKGIADTGTGCGMRFGLWLGLFFGAIAFASSYIMINVPVTMQFVDFFNTVISFGLAGAVIGWIYIKM